MSDYGKICEFVQGDVPPSDFEQYVYGPEFEKLTCDEPAPSFAAYADSLYTYAISVDFRSSGDMLSLQNVLCQFLQGKNITVRPSDAMEKMHALLLEVQPSWLDIPMNYMEALRESAGERQGKELKTFIKEAIKRDFRYLGKKPVWLQQPEWPMRDGRPLVFAGQLDLGDMLHDTARIYVFVDPQTKQAATVIQTA